jgi:hypothetical protein
MESAASTIPSKERRIDKKNPRTFKKIGWWNQEKE